MSEGFRVTAHSAMFAPVHSRCKALYEVEPSMAVEDSTAVEIFKVYAEYFLAQELKPGQVVVMDNLSAHKPKRVRKLIEGRGCRLLYLPSYSPGYNPTSRGVLEDQNLLRKSGLGPRGLDRSDGRGTPSS